MADDYTPTKDRIVSWLMEGAYTGQGADHRAEAFDAWLAEHDAKVRAEALREAYADLQAYTDSGAPFGHRPVEEFLLRRADRIEKESGL